MGKTSLLREAQRLFEQHGIETVWVTAVEGENLAASVLEEMRKVLPKNKRLDELASLIDGATITIGGGPLKAGVTVKPTQNKSPSAGKVFMSVVTDVV